MFCANPYKSLCSEDKLLFLITEIKCDDKMGSATVALLTQLPIPWSDQVRTVLLF